jgi:ABC-2 type transport system permease protein
MNVFRLMWSYFRIGAMNELQYRLNFFLQLLQSLTALATGVIGLAIVFTHTTELRGWSRPELLAVMGVHVLMGGVIRATIQPNMQRLMGEVQEGTLDFALTKPADSQVMVSVREIRIWQAVDVVVGMVLIAAAVYQLQSALSLAAVAGFLVALLLGAVMIYSFWLMLTTGAFWIVRMDQVVELFQGVYQAGRWPVGIYPGWLRIGLTFLVPIAFAVTVPAEALTGRLSWQALLGAAGLALALLVLARLVWRIGLRRYSGASA